MKFRKLPVEIDEYREAYHHERARVVELTAALNAIWVDAMVIRKRYPNDLHVETICGNINTALAGVVS